MTPLRHFGDGRRRGLIHVELGGYHVDTIEVVAAFDVDADKVGLDLSFVAGTGEA